MKFKKVVTLELVPQWQDRYVNFYSLKECVQYHAQSSVVVETEDEEDETLKQIQTLRVKNRRVSVSERKSFKVFESFEVELAKEVHKVDAFYKSRQDKFYARLNELNQQIDLMSHGGNVVPNAINALQKAYHDNHLHWKLLRKFHETNKYGFLKILKLHDSLLNQNQFDYFLETYLQDTSFWDSQALEATIAETKKVYTKYFAASDDRLAKSELRRSNAARQAINLFAVALFSGAIISLVIVCIVGWVHYYPSDPPSSTDVGWFVYRICLLPILLGCLFSLSSYLWERDNINYSFIFKFNPLHFRSPLMYLKYSLCLFSIWLLSFYFYMDSIISNSGAFSGLLHPLIFVVVVFTGFFLPLPILGHHTRYYLIREISRVLRAGLPGRINVSFADFIMAIQLIALSEFLFDFQIMFCMFGLRDDELCEDNFFAMPFLSALPHWCRMFQCVRRWRQTGDAYPHLASGVRPFTTLISTTLSVLARLFPEQYWLLYLWLGLNSIFSVIRWYLDILIDWSFVKFGFDFSLRKQRLYRPTWLYYFVMADNFFLRFVWLIVYLMRTRGRLDLNHPILLVFLSTFELLWGFQFVFFRMESEHFNCRDRYDIIHDVPLPFTRKYDELARENTLKKLRREKRRHTVVSKIHELWNKLPWTNSRHKLRESIARAIHEVELEHPLSRCPTVVEHSKLFPSSIYPLSLQLPSPDLSPSSLSSSNFASRLSLRLASSPSHMKRSVTSPSPLAGLHPPLTPDPTPVHSAPHSPSSSPPPSPPLSPLSHPLSLRKSSLHIPPIIPPSPRSRSLSHSPQSYPHSHSLSNSHTHLAPVQFHSPHSHSHSHSLSQSHSHSPSISASTSSIPAQQHPSFSPSLSSIPRSHSFSLSRRPSLHLSSERAYIPLESIADSENENENENENDNENRDGREKDYEL